jgi:hypothetical protein
MADYLLFQKAQHTSFSMNSAKRRRMTRQGLLALLCQNRRFEFQKHCQLFSRSHNETLSVAAMCVSNPVNVSRRMRANHGANPKGSKEGRRMNDTQTLVLIHTVAWPILIWALSKTWSSSRNAVRFSLVRTMKRPLIRV